MTLPLGQMSAADALAAAASGEQKSASFVQSSMTQADESTAWDRVWDILNVGRRTGTTVHVVAPPKPSVLPYAVAAAVVVAALALTK